MASTEPRRCNFSSISARKLEGAPLAFDPRHRFRKRLRLKHGLERTVDHRDAIGFVTQRGDKCILAANARIVTLRPAMKALHLAHQPAREIEQMQSDIHDGKSFEFGEVGLIAIIVVAVPKTDMGEVGISDIAGGDVLLQFPEWPLPAEILMHHQRPAGVLRGFDHRLCIRKGFRERLLADGCGAMRQRKTDQLAMRLRGGRHIDEIRRLGFQHLRRVGVDALDAETRSHRAGARRVEVANRNDFCARLRCHASI